MMGEIQLQITRRREVSDAAGVLERSVSGLHRSAPVRSVRFLPKLRLLFGNGRSGATRKLEQILLTHGPLKVALEALKETQFIDQTRKPRLIRRKGQLKGVFASATRRVKCVEHGHDL